MATAGAVDGVTAVAATDMAVADMGTVDADMPTVAEDMAATVEGRHTADTAMLVAVPTAAMDIAAAPTDTVVAEDTASVAVVDSTAAAEAASTVVAAVTAAADTGKLLI
jgi:hypothetical protein